jgi:hypothetical protein
MKHRRHDSRAPLNYIDLYPQPVETEKAPPLWAQALGVVFAAGFLYLFLVFMLSL